MGGKRKYRSHSRDDQVQPGDGHGFDGYPPSMTYDHGAFDNTGYYGMQHHNKGVVPRYPEPFGHPRIYDPEYRSRSTDAGISETSSTVSKSSRKKIILVTVIVIVCLVVAAIVAAVTVAMLTKDGSGKKEPQHEERIIIKTIPGEATLTDKAWRNEYNDPNSELYNTTATEFINKMNHQFQNSDMANRYSGTVVDGFRQGSVIVDYTITLSVPVDSDPSDTTIAPSSPDDNNPPSTDEANVQVDLPAVAALIGAAPSVIQVQLTDGDTKTDENKCSSNPCKNDGQCQNGIQYTCICFDGFTGADCEININECATSVLDISQCDPHGQCLDGINGYTCQCDVGYTGSNCEINIYDCDANLCANGATCIDGVDAYTCDCRPGYTGGLCQTDIDNCSPDPCINEVSCVDGVNTFTCNCLPGYTGNICQTDIDNCDPDPCANGGTCIDGVNTYTCNCMPGYTGNICQTDIDNCDPDPCAHGGTCVDGVNSYTCNCMPGYTGNICQTDIDNCDPDPCINEVSCVDGVNTFTCNCMPGYTGNICQTDIDNCDPDPCAHGGTCVDGVNTVTCNCMPGYTGNICQTDIDNCDPDPCAHGGTCIDGVNSYTCNCIPGYTGNICQTDVDDCEGVTCNDGYCDDMVNSFKCTCDVGFTGLFCLENIVDCEADTCYNGGTCIDEVDAFRCECAGTGFNGHRCQTNVDDCMNIACGNGECTDAVNGYSCECSTGYTGDHCGIDVDECASEDENTCSPNAKCANLPGTYTCTCIEGYGGNGLNCIDIDECASDDDACSPNAGCDNTDGSYTCTCMSGYEGNGLTCFEIYYCPTSDCSPNAFCIEEAISYRCVCMPGFSGDGHTCSDIDECLIGNDCSSDAHCANTEGSFSCTCMDGYEGDGLYCIGLPVNATTPTTSPMPTSTTTSPGHCPEPVYYVGLIVYHSLWDDEYEDKTSVGFYLLNQQVKNLVNILIEETLVLFCGSTLDNATPWLTDGVNLTHLSVNITVSGLQYNEVLNWMYVLSNQSTEFDFMRLLGPFPPPKPVTTSAPVATTVGPHVPRHPNCYDPGYPTDKFEVMLGTSADFNYLNETIEGFLDTTAPFVCSIEILISSPLSGGTVIVTVRVIDGTSIQYVYNALMSASNVDVWLMYVKGYDPDLNTTTSPSQCPNEVRYIGSFWLPYIQWNIAYNDKTSIEFSVLSRHIQDIIDNVTREYNLEICGAVLSSAYEWLATSSDQNDTTLVDINITVSGIQYADMINWMYTFSESGTFEFLNLYEVVLTTPGTTRPTSTTISSSNTTISNTTTSPSPSSTFRPCYIGSYQCYDGDCIPASFVCDNFPDCRFGEDEANCDCDFPLINCPESKQECYHPDNVCDGNFDCPAGSDEQDCPVVCDGDEFLCTKDEECIPVAYKCDGTKQCRDGTDEFVDCPYVPPVSNIPTVISIRLMDDHKETTDAGYGRVELRSADDLDSEWGTICDDLWTTNIATVICNELGLPTPGYAYRSSSHGEGKGPVLLRNIHCNGSENSIQDCQLAMWGKGDNFCTHRQDASLSCGVDILPTSTTVTPTGPPPTVTPPVSGTIRLVGGENCWSGRIEVLHQGIWGTVCDDGFGTADAQVVCRQLGFAGLVSYRNIIGVENGIGIIWLDNLSCSGSETSIEDCFHNGWGNHDCGHSEDQMITCIGDSTQCVYDLGDPNVTCSFDKDPCGYTTYSKSGDRTWKWTNAIYNNNYFEYTHPDGTEGDNAALQSPNFTASSDHIKLEYTYTVVHSTYGDLTLNRLRQLSDTTDMNTGLDTHVYERSEYWSTEYQSRDVDGIEQYNCVNMQTQPDTLYNIEFVATRGPLSSTTIRIGTVILGDGKCKTSLRDGICDFNRTSECGLRVVCPGCTRDQKLYTWSLATRPLGYHPYSTQQGNYMYVKSVYGSEEDTAKLQFLGLDDSLNIYKSIKFQSFMIGENTGSLEVMLLVDGDVFHTWDILTSSGSRQDWKSVCLGLDNVNVPVDTDVILQFIATKDGSDADIGIDNVQLSVDGCPIITCDEEQENCGFEIEIPVHNNQSFSSFTWSYTNSGAHSSDIVRLADGPSANNGRLEVYYSGEWRGVCSDSFGLYDARVVCRMLGYSTDRVTYRRYLYYGSSYTDFWLDDVDCRGFESSIFDCYHRGLGSHNCDMYDHVSVECDIENSYIDTDGYAFVIKDPFYSPIGTTTSLRLPSVYLSEGRYRFLLDVTLPVQRDLLLQVTYSTATQGNRVKRQVDQDGYEILGKRYKGEGSSERVCMPLDITEGQEGDYTIILTATKTNYRIFSTVAVGNIELQSGACQESLATHSCTFEDNYKCGYMISSNDTSCEAQYSWQRVKAENLAKSFTPDQDHTADNKTDGYYMYVSRTYGQSSNVAIVDLIEMSDTLTNGYCALSFYYFLSKQDTVNGGYMQVMTNGNSTNMEGSNDPIWLHGCIDLVDQCPSSIGSLEISCQASDVDAGLDDIQLLRQPCPAVSVNCDFNTEDVCGYIGQDWIWDNNGNIESSGQNIQNKLYSPLFDVTEESCIEIALNTSYSGYYILVDVTDTDGLFVSTTHRLYLNERGARTISLPLTTSDSQLQLVLGLDRGYSYYPLSVDYVLLSAGACSGPVLSCAEGQLSCDDNKCIREYNICDGSTQCQDKSDELNCDCSRLTFNCTDGNSCVHGSLKCDGTVDCMDGSDEICVPNVNCTFKDAYVCGYTITNANKETYGDGITFNYYGLSLVESPVVNVLFPSCLQFGVLFDYERYSQLRIVINKDQMYSEIASFDTAYYVFEDKLFNVDMPEGEYSLILESLVYYNHYYGYSRTILRNITLIPGRCTETIMGYTILICLLIVGALVILLYILFDILTSTSNPPYTASTSNYTTPWYTTTVHWWISSSTQTNRTSIPDDYPLITTAHELDPVRLSCHVENDALYEVIMYWSFLNNPIARNGDIMIGNETQTKYVISFMNGNINSSSFDYVLEVKQLVQNDTGLYQCVVDVLGYDSTIWPSAEENVEIPEDGCFSNPVSFCAKYGYNRVAFPSVIGLASDGIFKLFEMYKHLFGSHVQQFCSQKVEELLCGLAMIKCNVNGQTAPPTCKETCEEISRTCGSIFELTDQLDHFCKFLPKASEEEDDCNIITTRCGQSIFLLHNEYGYNFTSVLFRSQNYPSFNSPGEICEYNVAVEPYYLVNITVNTFVVENDDGCATRGLQMVDATGLSISECSSLDDVEYTFSGNTTLTLFTNDETDLLGFDIQVERVLPVGVCDIIRVPSSRYNYVQRNITGETCGRVKYYIQYTEEINYGIIINITDIDDSKCVSFINDNDEEQIQVCESGVAVNVSGASGYLSFDVGTQFKMIISTYYINDDTNSDLFITRVLLVGEEDGAGVLHIVRSDGAFGAFCDALYSQATADLLCQASGFGSKAQSYSYYSTRNRNSSYPGLVQEMYCSAGSTSLQQCYVSWNESCPTCSCYYNTYIDCGSSSGVSCNFNVGYCGYYYNSTVFVINYGGGITYTGSEGETNSLVSPVFAYTTGSSVKFKYGVDGTNSRLELYINSEGERRLLWRRPDYKQVGQYEACVELPDNTADVNLQLEFSFTSGSGTRVFNLISVEMQTSACQAPFPETACSFNNIENCASVLDDEAICPYKDTSVWSLDRHTLVGNSLYADEDIEYAYTISLPVSDTSKYFHFSYANTGSGFYGLDNDLTLKIYIVTPSQPLPLAVGDGSQYDEIFSDSENKSTSAPTCVTLPVVTSPDTYLSLVLVSGKSLGKIFIDDLKINDDPCPLSGSCDFENYEMCNYQIGNNNSVFQSWKVVSSSYFSYTIPTDNTFKAQGQGHFMVFYNEPLPDINPFSTSSIMLNEKTKCMSFYFTHGSYSDFIHLTLLEEYYENGDIVFTRSHIVGSEKHKNWTKVNFPIDVSRGYEVMYSFVARPSENSGLIAVDDVNILSTDCILGLQDMTVCTFDDPFLCNFETIGTTGSAYNWWRNETYELGSLMYVDNSYGDEGHTADIFFNVDLTSLTTDQSAGFSYQFEFMMTDMGAGSLITYNEMPDGNTGQEHVLQTRANEYWYDSDFYRLPANFTGRIYIQAIRGESQKGEIAVDNIKIVEGQPSNPSINCDFETTFCGYKERYGNSYLMDGSLLINSAARLDVPIQVLEADFTEGCISFLFNIDVGQSMKVKVETSQYDIQEYIFTGQNSFDPKYGQISLNENVTRVSFVTGDDFRGIFALDDVQLGLNLCASITTCTDGEFTCREQCVSATSQCDSKDDCNPPVDEENCGYSISCPFTPTNLCGYRNGTYSVEPWVIKTNYMYNEDIMLFPTGGTGDAFLISIFEKPTLKPSILHSASVTIDEISYLTFSYVISVPHLKVMVTYEETGATIEWVESLVTSTFEWKPAAILVSPGIATVSFTAYMIDPMHGIAKSDHRLVAIGDIQLISFDSIEGMFECPASMPYICSDYSKCYTDSMMCDGASYCSDGSDELGCAGGSGITCDFEYGQCNYTDSRQQNNWKRRGTYRHQIPMFDHTVGPVSNYSLGGHYMYFTSDPRRDVIYSVNLTSPVETFQDSGCITFWYWLNSTEVQPNALSAQILVYLNYQYQDPVLIWYDKVDRTFNTWVKGGFTVDGARAVSVTFVAITWLPFTVYPGTVAIDDVLYSTGTDCQVNTVCNEYTFSCRSSGTCIPLSFVCDGSSDCSDHSDEAQCDKPDGSFQLISGDGSYGELRYFQDGMWHEVCYPYGDSDLLVEFDVTVAQHVCGELGFKGNYESVNYYYSSKHTDSMVNLNCSNGTCTSNSNYCYSRYVAGLRCSHHVCFADEKLCPGIDNQCVKEKLFCDGLPDCLDGTDENNCRCLVEEVNTSVKCRNTPEDCQLSGNCAPTCKDQNKFECIDHECIPLEYRCDNKRDCRDGSDEHGCVRVEYSDDERVERVTVFDHHLDSLTRSLICIDSVGLSAANRLCRNAGLGYVASNGIQHGNEPVTDGLHVEGSPDETGGTLVHGIDVVERGKTCFPLQLYCEMSECGTTAMFEEQISSYIIHGDESTPGEWPWQIALMRDGEFNCGGTLIGGEWVLTAGHCVTGYDYMVRFGAITSNDLGPYGQEIPVARIHRGSYIDFTYGNDFALLELAYAPALDNYTRPICLATKESYRYFVDQGSEAECYITGFGATEDRYWQGDADSRPLKKVRVHIVDNETCSRIYQEYGQPVVVYDGICVQNEIPFDQACYGDSGGPLVCRNSEGRWEQLGVTSYGPGECNKYAPTVYSSVPIHLDWVKQKTNMKFTQSYNIPDHASNTEAP